MLERILKVTNLEETCHKVVKAKGANGVDKMSTSDLKNYLKGNKEELKALIRNRQYKPMPVRRVEIPKDDGSKRLLGIPTVIDRMVQQAIVQVLTPFFKNNLTSIVIKLDRNVMHIGKLKMLSNVLTKEKSGLWPWT